jgi:hypothetical protein
MVRLKVVFDLSQALASSTAATASLEDAAGSDVHGTKKVMFATMQRDYI